MAESTLPAPPPQSDTERHVVGYALAGVGAILFSMKAIIIKLAYGTGAAPAVEAITLLSLRMAFSLPVYFGIGVWSWRARKRDGRELPNAKQIVVIGAIGMLGYYVASYSDFVALSFITAQFERLILFTYPIFVMVLGAMFFGGRITRWGVIALCLSYAGIAFIYAKGEIATGPHLALGVGLMLLTALSFSLYQLFAKRWLNHDRQPRLHLHRDERRGARGPDAFLDSDGRERIACHASYPTRYSVARRGDRSVLDNSAVLHVECGS